VTGYEQGDLLAQAAIQEAEDHADQAWLNAAQRIVHELVQAGEPFTTDDVWDRLDRMDVHTHEPRALGAVMRHAARTGLIVNSGLYCKSSRAQNHARPIPRWIPRRAA
jgi:DNA-binding GntR family transcriptional regulator